MELVIRNIVPLSYNSKNKGSYQNQIRSALLRKYKGEVPKFSLNEELYGRIYFFTSYGVNVDCDNISKPIWDAMNTILYNDDREIIMRTASVIDVNRHPFTIIDTSSIDSDVAAELMQLLSGANVKCLYIECGKFNESMIKLGRQSNETIE